MFLVVNKMYPPEIGGVEVVAKVIADTLSENGHEVVVLTFNKRNELSEEFMGNTKVVRLPSVFIKGSVRISLIYKRKFKELAENAEVIIFNFPSGLPELFTNLYKKQKAKKICFYHADVVERRFIGWLYNYFVVQRFLNVMDTIITTSPNMATSSTLLKRHTDKVKVIPLFVDTSHFYPRDPEVKRRELLSMFPKRIQKIVMYIGRLAKYKGLEYLIRAMKFLNEEYGLVIIGEGPLKEKLTTITRENLLEDRILFLKHVPYSELPYYYSAADVFVLPSINRAEAFGLVVLEAMACGTPVITTELGTGTSYHNVSKKTGLVVPPKNSEALAEAIKQICEEDWKNNRTSVILARAKQFSIENFKKLILEVTCDESVR